MATRPRERAAAAVTTRGRRAPAVAAEENGSASTGGPAYTDGSDQLSLRRLEVAWPREVGGVGMVVPAAAASGGNWSRRAQVREEGRQGGHGGELYLAYDRAIRKNVGADTSFARSSMVNVRPRAA
jgi:hypothetical protein